MTRAKTDLFLLRALRRRSWAAGESDETEPSRFLLEVPEKLIERLGETVAATAPSVSDGGWSYEPVEEVRFAPKQGWRGGRSRQKKGLFAAPRRGGGNLRFPLGCTVRHAKFGEGTVLAVNGQGGDTKIEVHFVNYGRKKLLEKYASLERV
jgi:DNA helicase-2/ATP-dependent DNA helicase PcrA